jgi:hypothetical protein
MTEAEIRRTVSPELSFIGPVCKTSRRRIVEHRDREIADHHLAGR